MLTQLQKATRQFTHQLLKAFVKATLENGIFKNRKLGVFRYTIEAGFMDADFPEAAASTPGHEKLILDFGLVFCIKGVELQ